jgi:CheY-like chemotaxis protein
VFGAAEGMVIELGASALERGERQPSAITEQVSLPGSLPGPMDPVVLIAADPDPAGVLAAAVRADGGRLLNAANADALLRLALAERPALIFLQRKLAGRDALELCAALRSTAGSAVGATGVVIVASRQEDLDMEAGVRAGVTDWLLWPFKETYARARMHCWLLRQACRWSPAPLPADEEQRLHALQDLQVLDTAPEERFDRYTRIAAGLFDVPIALVSLVDRDRQWFKSCFGLKVTETPRESAFCAHAILNREVLQVPDALQDLRFADNPLVTGPPRVRFYAGAPLAAADGSLVGTLCLIDQRARQLDPQQLRLLRDVADLVEAELSSPADRHARVA